MKLFNKVRGTMKEVPSIEVNVDTVYVRSNIKRIEEPDFSGWEYDEIQYDKNNYIESIAEENEILKRVVENSSDMIGFHEDLLQEVIMTIL